MNPSESDAARHLRYATEFVVGDMKVHETPFTHGWTVTREEGALVLIGDWWEDSSQRHRLDIMRYFAYARDALLAAERDYVARTGSLPDAPWCFKVDH